MPCPAGAITIVPKTPNSPGPYAKAHPDCVRKFPITKRTFIDPEVVDDKSCDGWRHELKHDAESIFWLILYWAMVVQPKKCPWENINTASWSNLNGNYKKRETLIMNLSYSDSEGLTHLFYNPLLPLIKDLATIILIDSHWFPESDPQKDPCYITEVFQHLILQFIINNHGQEFMNHCVEQTFCTVQGMQASNRQSASHVQSLDATMQEHVNSVGCECGSMNSYLFLLLCLQGTDDVKMSVDDS